MNKAHQREAQVAERRERRFWWAEDNVRVGKFLLMGGRCIYTCEGVV